jgi:hypothetical protein
VVDPSTTTCALAFLAQSQQAADSFLTALVETMYPPMGRGSSYLTLKTTTETSVLLAAYSDDQSAVIKVDGAAPNVADAVRTSLKNTGAVVLLFGWVTAKGFELLKPSDNHLVRRQVTCDDVTIEGSQFDPSSLTDFLRLLDEESF